jgi:hypothetical protein
MTAPTPAPWDILFGINPLAKNVIAGCGWQLFIAATTRGHAVSKNEAYANARLIAAAPCLLEAAHLAVAHFKAMEKAGIVLSYAEQELWASLARAIRTASGMWTSDRAAQS